MTDPRIGTFVNALTEDEALDVFHQLRSRFGWAGTVFITEDITSELDEYELNERDLTPDERERLIEAVKWSWEWRKGMTDYLVEEGNSLLYTAVQEAIDKLNKGELA